MKQCIRAPHSKRYSRTKSAPPAQMRRSLDKLQTGLSACDKNNGRLKRSFFFDQKLISLRNPWVRRPSSFYSFPGEVLFRASYWYVSIQKLPFSSRLLSACGATPGHVSVLLERSWECSGSMRKNKETCER